MNKKYALFGIAALLAVAGVIYIGSGSNLQASVGMINGRQAQPITVKPPADTDSDVEGLVDERVGAGAAATIPSTIHPALEKEVKNYLTSVAALEKKLQTISPSSGSDRKIYYLGHGLCVSVGPLGGNPRYFSC